MARHCFYVLAPLVQHLQEREKSPLLTRYHVPFYLVFTFDILSDLTYCEVAAFGVEDILQTVKPELPPDGVLRSHRGLKDGVKPEWNRARAVRRHAPLVCRHEL